MTATHIYAHIYSTPCNVHTGVCAWPGIEGQVLALSALLRQPLSAVLLQHLPASGAHQAALHGVTLAGHVVQVLVFMQLQPPALASGAPGSSQSAVQVRGAGEGLGTRDGQNGCRR